MTIPQLYQLFLQHPNVSTDTRKIPEGALFFALRGDHFNGNEFAGNALAAGASFAVVDDASLPRGEHYIFVEDVQKCLQELATYHRNQLTIPVIAITGTNGKTTTKELIHAVLSRKFNTLATAGNLNNHIGVPLTLLSIKKETEIAIVEMGANHCGEIDLLCNLARPTYGIITNVGKAHLEGFGSFEGVIRTKTELYRFIAQNNGKIFLNLDNELLVKEAEGINTITYGMSPLADLVAVEVKAEPYVELTLVKPSKSIAIRSHLYGIYNAENIMAAACIGSHFGVDDDQVCEAIAAYQPVNNRSQVIQTRHNQLIMDAYNANPTSMEAAVTHFSKSCHGNGALILGDMLELGQESDKEHKKLLDLIKELGFKEVYLIGPVFTQVNRETSWHCFHDGELAQMWLEHHPILDHTILLKGSRGMKLETLVPLL